MWYEILPRVLNMSLTAAVIILFVCICRLLLKKAPKIYSYALWSVVLFRLLCPVSLSAPVSLLGLFHTPVAEVVVEDTEDISEEKEVAAGTANRVEYIPDRIVHEAYPEITLPVGGSEGVVAGTINQALPQGEEQLGAEPLEASISLLTYLWMLGILVMLGSGVESYIVLRNKLTGAQILKENIYLADHIPGPFVMGLIKPQIYLPSDLKEKEYAYIILHEKHHIGRGDHIFKVLGYLALSIHWFNPLVWVAFRLFVKDMEMSCDEAVLRKLGDEVRADYSASLLQFATGQKNVFGTPLAFGEGETKERIHNLSTWKKPKKVISLIAIVLCVMAIMFCFFNPTFVKESLHMDKEEQVDASSEETLKSEKTSTESSQVTILEEQEIMDANHYDWIGQIGDEGLYFSSAYPTGEEVLIFEFTGDITHDGCDDLIQVAGYSVEESPDVETVTSINSEGCYVKVFEGKSDGNFEEAPIFISRNYHMAHMGNGTICMSEVNGKKYLLAAETSEGQGEADYRFAAFYVDSKNGIVVEEQSKVKFSVDKESHEDWDDLVHREDVINEFSTKTAPFLKESVLLLSMDVNEDTALYSRDDEVIEANTYFEKVWARED